MSVAKLWFRSGEHDYVQDMPTDHVITRLNDQHAYLQCPTGSPVKVGDLVGLGISHPCTTFDKWSLIYLVNDDYDVFGGIRTYF